MADAAPRTRAIIDGTTRPVMPPHVKLRHDAGRGRWLIRDGSRSLSPPKERLGSAANGVLLTMLS